MNSTRSASTRARRAGLALAAGALGSCAAFAGGIYMTQLGTEDLALATAGKAARAQDASTILTNPAGMALLEGNHFMGGLQLGYFDMQQTLTPTTNTATGGNGGQEIGLVPNGSAYLVLGLAPDVKFGFGMAPDFGMALKYDSDWAGRYYSREATLAGVDFLPSLSCRVNDQFALGFSVSVRYGMLDSKTAVNNVQTADGQLEVKDHSWGIGANLGILYQPSPATRLGLAYTSEMKLTFKPNTEFTGLNPALYSFLSSHDLLDARLNLDIHLPQTVTGSFYHQLDPRWALMGNLGWQQWSHYGRTDVTITNVNNPVSFTSDLNYKDVWHGALGAQFQKDARWRYSFGISYDSRFQDSATTTVTLPADANWSFGAGLHDQASATYGWGAAVQYDTGNSVRVSKTGGLSPSLGGRGDIVTRDNPKAYFLGAYASWKF